ncbi:glycosyltransferase family 39 protein [Candidatus Woesearchaeota archaeon]|nr:glycosyltransferase family 39 protein [Candidatus Woesearchaeota archaeon]
MAKSPQARIRKEHLLLALIFLLTLAIRLSFAFQTPYLSTDESYLVLRQADGVRESLVPSFQDPFSYGGRSLVYKPLFSYLLGLLGLISDSVLLQKAFVNVLASLLVFPVYLIARELTKSENAALFAGFIGSFIPLYVARTTNALSVYALLAPVLLTLLYLYLLIMKDEKASTWPVTWFLLLFLVAVLSHSSAVILVLGLLFYMVLVRTERLTLKGSEVELIIFSAFFFLWIEFLIFKKAFLFHGPLVIWQNLPPALLSGFFAQVDVLGAVLAIGAIPFVAGIYIIYKYVFRQRRKEFHLMIGVVLAIAFLLWLRLIELDVGLLFLGCMLAVLFAEAYRLVFAYLAKTKISRYRPLIITLVLLIFVLNSVFPSISFAAQELAHVPADEDIAAFAWLRENTPENAIVLVPYTQGHALTYFARRKSVADGNFLLVEDPGAILHDIDLLYTTTLVTKAVEVADMRGIDYVLLSQEAIRTYNTTALPAADPACFVPVYEHEDIVYEARCSLEER